jgi:hypothetical protein
MIEFTVGKLPFLHQFLIVDLNNKLLIIHGLKL